jgi:hypothetical protein
MKRIDNKTAFLLLRDRANHGNHIDSRLLREIQHGAMYSFMLEDPEAFLSLIWQESDSARFLTPPDKPRTLRDVAGRFVGAQHTFVGCMETMGMPLNMHNPHWFRKCLAIENDFSYDRLGPVVLVSATDAERRQSPEGTFYIFDGIHKTLVLSVLFLQGRVAFESVLAFLIVPRR